LRHARDPPAARLVVIAVSIGVVAKIVPGILPAVIRQG